MSNEEKKKRNKKTRTKKKVSAWQVIKNILATLLVLGIIGGIAIGAYGIHYIKGIIDESPEFDISRFNNSESTKIYSSDNVLIADVGVVNRENVSYEEIPQAFIDAVVAVEDSRYFEHNGFDIPRFVKAMIVNVVKTIQTRRINFSQGASTLTMQLVRNVYFINDETGADREKGIPYKIQQIYLALKTEEELNKKRILELYLNRINFGASTTRGIKGAAEYYFGKDVSELSLSECAYLAGVINAPATYNAFKNCDALEYVLLSEGVGAVLDNAFDRCGALLGISIPAKTTEISSDALSGCEKVTVSCPSGSKAATALSSHTISTEKGDVDGDELNIMDASAIQHYIALLTAFDGAQVAAADVNYDADIDIMDAFYIQMRLAGYESDF